jgi:glycerol-3-phosphate acyltransferase PlsY
MNSLLFYIALPILAFLLGSVPFGLLITRIFSGEDIRKAGSGNIGATNVKRLMGTRWGAMTLALDVAKGALPTWAALYLSPGEASWLAGATMLAAVCGHMYPAYLKFKPSGKGVATAGGCILVSAPLALTVALMAFIGMVSWTRRISIGSLSATAVLPPAVWFSTQNPALLISSLIIMVLILHRHEDNIRRLAHGSEPPFSR